MSKPILELKNISLAYDRQMVVKSVSFSLKKGQIGCLLGASGCGKTTILRAIAGFEPLVGGEIHLNKQLVSRQGWTLPPEKRSVGMVFQDYALFPHLSVFDNVAFGLRGMERSERLIRINEILDMVGLGETHNRFPHELSGGQQQRVALARSLALRPELLVMDEPFSNLDVTLRERLSMEVRDILKEFGITALIVTHNQSEAFALADEVGVMDRGEMQQWNTPHSIYHRPATPFVAQFVGEGVLLPGKVRMGRGVETGLGMLCGGVELEGPEGSSVSVLIRPEDVVHDDSSAVKAEVLRRTFRGANVLYSLRLENGDQVLALVPSHCEHSAGEKIGIQPYVQHVVLYDSASALMK